MATQNVNLLWKSFKGIRKLNTINSDTELGADNLLNVRLSKEKSGQQRSIKSSGWFNDYVDLAEAAPGEKIIRLFSANLSGYNYPNQLIAFTRSTTNINAWIVEDDSGILGAPIKIAEFSLADDVYDCCMTQWGDRLSIAVAFGKSYIGFITYSGTNLTGSYGWTTISNNWYYRTVDVEEGTTGHFVKDIRSIRPYNSRLAVNGRTEYTETHQEGAEEVSTLETIYGVWFSEAGQPLNFSADLLTSATDTSAFFVETGEYVNKLVEYSGLVAFCRNRSYNIHGTTQNNIACVPLTAKGVIGNAAFVLNGECAYVDDFAHNAFVLKGNIDDTIGFDGPIGDEIQDFLTDVENVTINAVGRRVRMLKETGESLIYDVDIGEWTVEKFVKNARCVTFLDKEIFCDGTGVIKQITNTRTANSTQTPLENQYYSYYKTNLIWLDSQSSVKSHIYPFAIILEPQTNNDFKIRFTTDRNEVYEADVVSAGYENVAKYSATDAPFEASPEQKFFFVTSDSDRTGGVFFGATGHELLKTVDRPPFWRYLQIEIYTDKPGMEFNIAGIEAKNTFITDEMLDY